MAVCEGCRYRLKPDLSVVCYKKEGIKHMKNRWLVLPLLITLLLCSCGQQTGAVQTVNTGVSNETDIKSEDESGVQTAFSAEAEAAGPFSEKDLVFIFKGTQYPLNSDAAPLLEAFGPDYKETKAPSCAYIGEDKVFEYDFATIYTYPLDGKDLIDEIDFFKGEYMTNRGVGLGSTLDEVKSKYGSEGFDIDGMYTFVLSGKADDLKSPKLYFELTDGTVTGISYYAASNVQ